MKFAAEIDPVAVIYIKSFTKLCSGIQKFMWGIHRRQTEGMVISYPNFYFSR
jgi:hypothetical protein